MPIATQCPSCQAQFRLPDELAGRRVKCQKCGQIFQAPLAGEASAPASAPPAARPAPSSAAPPPTAPPPTAPPRPAPPRAAPAPAVLPRPPAPQPVEEEIIEAKLTEDDAPVAPERAIRAERPAPVVDEPERTPPRRLRDDDRSTPRREPRDREPRRSPRPARQGSDPWVMVGIFGGVVVLIGSVVVGVMMFTSDAPAPMMPGMAFNPGPMGFKPNAQVVFPPPGFGPNVNVPPLDPANAIKIALVKGSYEAKHALAAGDPLDPQLRQPCKMFLVSLEAGKTYIIDQIAPRERFDSLLRLENPQGQQVAMDDDGGGFPNARIRFMANQAGAYRVIATSLSGGVGEFTLAIRDSTMPAPAQPLAKVAPPIAVRTVTDEPIVIKDSVTRDDPPYNGSPAKEYRFQIEAGRSYKFECTSDTFKPMIRAADSTGKPGGAALNNTGRVELTVRPQATGAYHIYVSGLGNTSGAFTLTASKGAAEPVPPKTTPPKATAPKTPTTKPLVKSLVGGATKPEITASDQLALGDEPKVFSILPKVGATYTIEVQAQGFAPALKITSATGEVRQEARAKDGGASVQVSYRAEGTGRIHLHVSADDKKTGKFTLSIRH